MCHIGFWPFLCQALKLLLLLFYYYHISQKGSPPDLCVQNNTNNLQGKKCQESLTTGLVWNQQRRKKNIEDSLEYRNKRVSRNATTNSVTCVEGNKAINHHESNYQNCRLVKTPFELFIASLKRDSLVHLGLGKEGAQAKAEKLNVK